MESANRGLITRTGSMPLDQIWRHFKTKRLGGVEIDDQIMLGRRLYGQFGRFLAFEYPIDIARRRALAAAVLGLALFADPLDRDHLLILGGVEHDHALGRASGDADAVHRAADQLAAVGDQHKLIGFFHRERSDQRADLLLDRLGALLALPDRHRDQAFAAAVGDPVFVGRRAFAVAALGYRQDELLGGRHLDVALLAELNGARRGLLAFLGVRRSLFQLFA